MISPIMLWVKAWNDKKAKTGFNGFIKIVSKS